MPITSVGLRKPVGFRNSDSCNTLPQRLTPIGLGLFESAFAFRITSAVYVNRLWAIRVSVRVQNYLSGLRKPFSDDSSWRSHADLP